MPPKAKTKACVQCADNPLLRSVCTACGGTGEVERAPKRKKPAPVTPVTGELAPPVAPSLVLDLPEKPGPFADPLSALRGVWGYPRFRAGQREIVDAVLAGGDVIGIAPTGLGKAMMFQLPALMRQDRPTLVMSPLIALMRDQVSKAQALGIPAVAVTSQYTQAELDRVIASMPRCSLIYAAPERFDDQRFQRHLLANPPWLVALDEAHVAGHEAGLSYRPAYRFARDLLDQRGAGAGTQWLAVTASATEETVEDIRETFRMQGAQLIRLSCDRPNLSYRVQRCADQDKSREVRTLLREHLKGGGAGIVYTLRRQDAEDLAYYLSDRGIEARHYHAGMTGKNERREVEEAFFGKKLDVVVATCAFGMGVDRGDVRIVVMHGMPKSVEDFYQMAGRGGRDGKPSVAVALYGGRDYSTRKWLIQNGKDLNKNQYSQKYGFRDDKFDTSKQRQLALLGQLDAFLTSWTCRSVLLRRYFGEESGRPCGNCDNCIAQAPRKVASAPKSADTVYEIGALAEPKGEIARQLFEDSLNDPLGEMDEDEGGVPF